MSTTSPKMSAPTPTSLGPTLRLRPAQAAPVRRRGQPAGGEGLPVGGDGCTPSGGKEVTEGENLLEWLKNPFAGGDED
jgi:hypothetical protein